MDATYLQATIGPLLATGLAEVTAVRPADPVDYLAQYLLKSTEAGKEAAALAEAKAVATRAEEAKRDVQAAAERDAKNQAAAAATQASKEDARLEKTLAAATTQEEVFAAVLGYMRARTGTSAYIALSDLPEKEIKIAAEVAEAAKDVAADGGEEAPPPPADAEPAAEMPKFVPQALTYTAATQNDAKLLVGKTLTRPLTTAGEEGGDESGAAAGARGVGEGVSFDAVDAYIARKAKYLHIPRAAENASVKFWHIPRAGAFLCSPFVDADGDIQGVLSLDTLGLDRPFDDFEIQLATQTSEKLGAALARVEQQWAEQNAKDVAELTELYASNEDEAAKELEEAAKVEDDKLAPLKVKFRRAARDIATLEASKVAPHTCTPLPPSSCTLPPPPPSPRCAGAHFALRPIAPSEAPNAHHLTRFRPPSSSHESLVSPTCNGR